MAVIADNPIPGTIDDFFLFASSSFGGGGALTVVPLLAKHLGRKR
jgi:hypothetical protein